MGWRAAKGRKGTLSLWGLSPYASVERREANRWRSGTRDVISIVGGMAGMWLSKLLSNRQ
jgi:hypothetical protein